MDTENALKILQDEIKKLRIEEREAKAEIAYKNHELAKAERSIEKLGSIVNVMSTVIGNAVTIPVEQYGNANAEPNFRIYENGDIVVVMPEKAYEEMEDSFKNEYIDIRKRAMLLRDKRSESKARSNNRA